MMMGIIKSFLPIRAAVFCLILMLAVSASACKNGGSDDASSQAWFSSESAASQSADTSPNEQDGDGTSPGNTGPSEAISLPTGSAGQNGSGSAPGGTNGTNGTTIHGGSSPSGSTSSVKEGTSSQTGGTTVENGGIVSSLPPGFAKGDY